MLRIENLTLSIGNNVLLDGASAIIGESEIVGLIAPNGTGKTTLLRSVAGLNSKVYDNIAVTYRSRFKHSKAHDAEVLITPVQRTKFHEMVYYLEPHNMLFSDMSVHDHLKFVSRIFHQARSVEEIIKQFDIAWFLNKKVNELSLGMLQIFALALGVLSGSPYLLFDEPFNGLDQENIARTKEILTSYVNQGGSILMSSHDLNTLQSISSRSYFMVDKKLVEHSVDKGLYTDLYKKYYQDGGRAWASKQ